MAYAERKKTSALKLMRASAIYSHSGVVGLGGTHNFCYLKKRMTVLADQDY